MLYWDVVRPFYHELHLWHPFYPFLFFMRFTIKLYSTSNLSSSGSLVQPLHVPLLTNVQGCVHKHLKERQPSSLVDLPGIQAILVMRKKRGTQSKKWDMHKIWPTAKIHSATSSSLSTVYSLLRSSSPCCREKWSWRCTPARRQQTVAPPQQCAGCSLRGPLGWSPGFCSAPDGCCPHPKCSRGCRDRPGTPLKPCSRWSSLRRTNLEETSSII